MGRRIGKNRSIERREKEEGKKERMGGGGGGPGEDSL